MRSIILDMRERSPACRMWRCLREDTDERVSTRLQAFDDVAWLAVAETYKDLRPQIESM